MSEQMCMCVGRHQTVDHGRGDCKTEASGYENVPAENLGHPSYLKAGLLRRTPMCTGCLELARAVVNA